MNAICVNVPLYATSSVVFTLVARAKAASAGLTAPIVEPRTVPMFFTCGVAVAVLALGAAGCSYAAAVGLAVLAVSSASDIECGFIFDCVTLPGLALVLCVSLFDHRFLPAVEGTSAAACTLGTLYIVTRGRGVGLGDVKAAAVLGATLGPAASIRALGLAFVSGAAVAIASLLCGRTKIGDSVRFAPFIALGAFGCVIFSVVSE